MNASKSTLKYKNWIIVVSIAIPVVVAFLFRIRLENVQSLSFLPPIYAAVNGYTAIILLVALWAIKNRKINLHEQLMKTAIGLSLAFLVMYVAYHLTSDPTPFGGEGVVKTVYYTILISHILLSISNHTLGFDHICSWNFSTIHRAQKNR